MTQRCPGQDNDPLYIAYHDEEWGVPERDDRALFEKLVLDGFQAGLAWITILRKRETMRAAFDRFDPYIIARYGEADINRLMGDAGIIRSRAKIKAAIGNARAWIAIQEAGPGFSAFLWDFVDGVPVQNRHTAMSEVPAQTEPGQAMAKALKQAGFKFCGPVIVYAFMQAVGMVNDHLVTCPRHGEVARLSA